MAKSGNGRKRKKNRDQQRKKITSLQMKCSVDNGIVTQKRSIVVCVLFFVFFVLDDYTNLLSWSFKWRHIESPLNMHVLSKHKQIIIYLMIYKLRLNKTKHSEKTLWLFVFNQRLFLHGFFPPIYFISYVLSRIQFHNKRAILMPMTPFSLFILNRFPLNDGSELHRSIWCLLF